MELNQTDIAEFKSICVAELGIELSETEAVAEAQQLLDLMRAVILQIRDV